MISSILLSAGQSKRFGAPKALAKLNGQIIIERLQRMLIVSRADEIVVVLGAWADRINSHLLNHKKVKVVYNKDYNFGQTSSFKVGLQNTSNATEGIMLVPVDCPNIKAKTVDTLIKQFLEKKPRILIPAFNGKKGHPPLFSADLHDEFLSLDNTIGLNSIVNAHKKETIILPTEDSGVIQTFNTTEELQSIKPRLFKDDNRRGIIRA